MTNHGETMTTDDGDMARASDVPFIDTTGMEPPQPFVTIMAWIDANPGAPKVIVRLERNPVYLFPELVEINWQWEYLTEETGRIELLLKRQTT